MRGGVTDRSCVRIEMHAGFWWGNMKERYDLVGRGINEEDNIEMDFK